MRKNFTLIEVVVAIAILGLSLSGLLQLLTQSQLRIANARTQWHEMHMLTQGVEYLLMNSRMDDLSVPDEVFPYDDYQIDCTVEDADGLPEELTGQSGQLPLKKWTITLIRMKDRRERLSVVIDRFGYEEADDVQ
ncbi:MAG: prepilin-type N-terminal cleavage/methylation domain-containing protein [Lentisphaeria bacterium]|nr:prepilin-type N-terminal cleavage/methylation domain-containing protein [Lentisphaeria bacterium]